MEERRGEVRKRNEVTREGGEVTLKKEEGEEEKATLKKEEGEEEKAPLKREEEDEEEEAMEKSDWEEDSSSGDETSTNDTKSRDRENEEGDGGAGAQALTAQNVLDQNKKKPKGKRVRSSGERYQITRMREQLSEWENRYKLLMKYSESLDNREKELRDEIQRLTVTNNHLTSRGEHEQEITEQHKKELQSFQETLKMRTEEIEKTNTLLTETRKEINSKEDQVISLNERIKTLNVENQALANAKAAHERQMEEMFQSEIDRLQKAHDQKEGEWVRVRSNLEGKIKSLEDDKDNFLKSKSNTEGIERELVTRNKGLKEEVDELKAKADQMTAEIEKYRGDKTSIKREMVQLETERDNLQNNVQLQSKMIDNLNHTIKLRDAALKTSQDDMSKTQKLNSDEKEQLLATISANKTQHERDYQALRSQNELYHRQLTESQDEINRLAESAQSLQVDNANLVMRLNKSATEMEELKIHKEALLQENSKANVTSEQWKQDTELYIKERDTMIGDLQIKNQGAESAIEQLRTELNEAKNMTNQTEQKYHKLNEEHDALRINVEQLNILNQELQTNFDERAASLAGINDENKRQISQLNETIAGFSGKETGHEEAMDRMKKKFENDIQTLQNQLAKVTKEKDEVGQDAYETFQEMSKQREELHKNATGLGQKLCKRDVKIQTLKDKITKIKGEGANIEQMLNDKNEKYDDLVQKLALLREENGRMEDAKNEHSHQLEIEKDSLRNELEDKSNEIKNLISQNNELQSENEKLRHSNLVNNNVYLESVNSFTDRLDRLNKEVKDLREQNDRYRRLERQTDRKLVSTPQDPKQTPKQNPPTSSERTSSQNLDPDSPTDPVNHEDPKPTEHTPNQALEPTTDTLLSTPDKNSTPLAVDTIEGDGEMDALTTGNKRRLEDGDNEEGSKQPAKEAKAPRLGTSKIKNKLKMKNNKGVHETIRENVENSLADIPQSLPSNEKEKTLADALPPSPQTNKKEKTLADALPPPPQTNKKEKTLADALPPSPQTNENGQVAVEAISIPQPPFTESVSSEYNTPRGTKPEAEDKLQELNERASLLTSLSSDLPDKGKLVKGALDEDRGSGAVLKTKRSVKSASGDRKSRLPGAIAEPYRKSVKESIRSKNQRVIDQTSHQSLETILPPLPQNEPTNFNQQPSLPSEGMDSSWNYSQDEFPPIRVGNYEFGEEDIHSLIASGNSQPSLSAYEEILQDSEHDFGPVLMETKPLGPNPIKYLNDEDFLVE
uniref:Uncharacterized protein n=1 Tax=Dikerogammarus haemobaphes virus 1 TaxID=2704946 RepID=A0A6G9HDK9_9VIRU|nr:hypothetical protein [Dikerogammarus haemobaphes virus 1]